MTNIQLDDLVYTYPDITDPLIQTKLSAKQEFKELATSRDENIPRRGEFFKHQRQIMRYLLEYDRLLMIHRAGTGKTCAVVGSSELFKRALSNAISDIVTQYITTNRTHIKHVHVLVKGPALEAEFKNQIVCRCTKPGTYETKQVKSSKTERARRANISKSINTFYTIESYGDLARKVMKSGYTNEQIKQLYSGTLFIVDEAHNLRLDDAETLGENAENIEETNRRAKNKELIYKQLHRIFHLVERSKIVLLTATPAVNDPSEMITLMNLILPIDNQIPTNFNFEAVVSNSPEVSPQIEPFFRGIISYVREMDTDVVATYKGEVLKAIYDLGPLGIYRSQQIVTQHIMSEFQTRGYLAAKRRSSRFRIAERQAANFVFPDGSSGPIGYKKYVIEEGVNSYKAKPELLEVIRNMSKLRNCAIKYANVISAALSKQQNQYIFEEYIHGSGSIVLSLCFEAQGFSRFREQESIFSTTQKDPGGLQPFCPAEEPSALEGSGPGVNPNRDTNTRVRQRKIKDIKIVKAKRYALFISSTPDAERATILQTFNSWENRYGEYIQVLIVSPFGREGINTSNVLAIDLMGGGWNESLTYQALSRALRATSHVDLLEEERQKYRERGLNPDDAKIEVTIRQHAAIPMNLEIEDEEVVESTATSSTVAVDSTTSSSVVTTTTVTTDLGADIAMYELSETKDIRIKRSVERPAKQVAFDCQINYERNVVKGVDGSAKCDYDICQYTCSNPIPTTTDFTSYNVLYIDEIIDMAVFDLVKLFSTHFILSINEISVQLSITSATLPMVSSASLLRPYTQDVLVMALSKAIEQKIVFTDRFGFSSYLQEDGNKFFLIRDFPLANVKSSQSRAYYSENLMAINKFGLSEFVKEQTSEEQQIVISNIINQTGVNLTQSISSLNLENQIKLLEQTISLFATGTRNPGIAGILNHFRSSVFSALEPIEEIEKYRLEETKVKTRGRKPKIAPTPETPPPTPPRISVTPQTVYFHNLLGETGTETSYGVAANAMKRGNTQIRLLKPVENLDWKNTTVYENLAYNDIIFQITQRRRAPYEQFDIYGTILKDKKFRLAGKFVSELEDKKKDLLKEDAKPIPGHICLNDAVEDLLEYLYHLKVTTEEYVPSSTKEQMIEFILNKRSSITPEMLQEFSSDKLRFFYKYLYLKFSKEELCGLIRQYLAGLDRIYVA